MECRVFTSPITKKEVTSETWEALRQETGSAVGADDLYNEFFTPEFLDWFGNWIENPTVERDVNEIGEPTPKALSDWLSYNNRLDQLSENFLSKSVETNVVHEATPQELKKFKVWAERAGLTGRYLDKMVINGKVHHARGIAKIAQNLYYVLKGAEVNAEPEEIMHFAVNAIEESQPELFNKMLNKIGSDPIYDPVFEIYKDAEGYRLDKNRVDVRKIKIEAITKRLVNTFIEREREGFWANIWEEIKLWFSKLMKKADFDPFREAAINIARGKTYGAENMESLKPIVFRVIKSNPQGEVGQQFRKLYNEGKYRDALSLLNDKLLDPFQREKVIEEVLNGSESLAELIVHPFGEEFYSASPQAKLFDDIKTNKGVPITKEINPDQKEEDGSPKQMYKVGEKWVKRRVTDIVKALYKRIFGDGDMSKSQYQKAVDEIKRNYGVEGHKDIEHAFDVLVDSDGNIRTTPLDDSEYKALTTKGIYNLLKKNLNERLHSFPAGTRFLSEAIIYDDKRDIGGTIDFLAIEPDGKVSILDWKFMDINTEKVSEVPFYKRRAYRVQIAEYRRILSERYGVPLSKFRLTQAIPIRAEYSYPEAADGKKYPILTGIQIGDVNIKAEKEDYLLPVALESQSTGDKQLDKLLRRLMGLRSIMEDRQAKTFEEKFSKAEQLNILEKAIRHIQIKQSIEPFVEQADIYTKDVRAIIDHFEENLKDKDFNTIEYKELSDYGIRLNRAFDEIEIYTNLDNEVKSLFKGELTEEEEELKNKISAVVSRARALRAELEETTNDFGVKLAEAKKINDLLTPEAAVSSVKKWFSETSKLPTSAIKAMYEYRREAQNKMDIATAEEGEELDRIAEEYDKLAKSKGWKDSNYFDILKKKDKNELIDQYQKDFYIQVKKAVKAKDVEWIKKNIDTKAYEDELKKRMEKQIEIINAKPWDEERKNKQINATKLMYNTLKWESYGWFSHKDVLKKFPLKHWESTEWVELHKPENKAALDTYNWIIKINKKAKSEGYLPKGKSARTFLPFVPKSLMERLLLGGDKAISTTIAENMIRSLTIDEDSVGYGAIDPVTMQLVNKIPKYLTGNSENRELSDNLFKNLNLYNEFVNKYKYLSEIEGIVLALGRVERNKGSILTSQYGSPIFNKEKNEFELVDSNDKNADLYDKQVATLIYGQKYVNSEKFDQVLGNVGSFCKAINKFFGIKILPENFTDAQLSLNKFIDVLNTYFQMKTLGLSPLPALSNFIGGNLQLQVNAGKYFTKTDIIKAEAQFFYNMARGEEGKKMIAALKYFIPFTRDTNRDVSRKLSTTPLTETGIQDFLMVLMRGGDKVIEATIFGAILKNAVLIDGKIYNAREYVSNSLEYKERYSSGDVQEKEKGFDKAVEELKKQYSLLDKIELKGDEMIIPGVSRSSEEVFKLRNLTKAMSKRAVGNLSPEEIRDINQNIITNSMMIFKNWIPSLFDLRIGQLKYSNDVEAWEWGRMRTIARFLSVEGIKGLKGMYDAVRGTKGGIETLNRIYESKKDSYYKATGKELQISKEEFFDMTRRNIRQQAKDTLITISLLSLFVALKAVPPDEDEDDGVKNRHKFMVRMLDKISDELSFYYDPNALQQILNGQIFPSLSVFVDASKLINNFLKEVYGIVLDDELQEKTHAIKYLMRSFPLTSQLSSYMPLYAPDLAKDLGIQMSSQARLR